MNGRIWINLNVLRLHSYLEPDVWITPSESSNSIVDHGICLAGNDKQTWNAFITMDGRALQPRGEHPKWFCHCACVQRADLETKLFHYHCDRNLSAVFWVC